MIGDRVFACPRLRAYRNQSDVDRCSSESYESVGTDSRNRCALVRSGESESIVNGNVDRRGLVLGANESRSIRVIDAHDLSVVPRPA